MAGLKPQFGKKVIAQLNNIQNVGHILPMPMAQYTAKQAREYAHVITGYMRNHIKATKVSDTEAVVESGATYSGYEEWGTRFRPPHPFLRPAMADASIHLPDMSAKEVNREIRRRVSKA